MTRETLVRALACYQAGDKAQAERLCRELIDSDPKDGPARRLMGSLQLADGKCEEAAVHFRHALAATPDDPELLNNLGVACDGAGESQEALGYFREAIRQLPRHAAAHLNLGNALLRQGHVDDAIRAYLESLRIRPGSTKALTNLARAHTEKGCFEKAADYCREAIRLSPENPELHVYLGNVLSQQRNMSDAAACYHHALRLQPHAPAHYIKMANALNELGQHSAAMELLRHAQQKWPNMPELYLQLGDTYKHQRQFESAVEEYRHGLKLKRESAEILNNLGNVYKHLGQLEQAIRCYREVLRLRPHDAGARSRFLLLLNYDPDISTEELFQEHVRWARHNISDRQPPLQHANTVHPERRLRVGYLSPDFRQNVVRYFIEPILRHHDPQQVETTLYSDVSHPDEQTELLHGLAQSWRDIFRLPDERVAEMIQADGIDILVDLAGHVGSRLQLAARRPAPIQVTYLGYPYTTGLSQIDYRLTDSVADPLDSSVPHTEKLLRLPGCFACYLPPSEAPEVSALPAGATGSITFGSLHGLRKINRKVLDLWARVLHATPGSRMLLFRHTLTQSARDHLSAEFARRGVAAGRIELRQAAVTDCSHLTIYHEIDVALDVFPWCGHATACESLWMGVPVVTLAGSRHAGRMVASVLTALGLQEWIARSPQEYVQIAQRLAGDLDRLNETRGGLRAMMAASRVCDGRSFTRRLEEAYRDIWRDWCRRHSTSRQRG